MHQPRHVTPATRWMPALGWLVLILIVLATVVLPRIGTLSAMPSTDEGFMAYFAMRTHAALLAHQGLPADGTLMVYPLTLFWVFGLDLQPLVALRAVDMGIAALASLLLLRLLVLESRSLVIGAAVGAVFLQAMNDPSFVQSGFKNSLYAAYLPLFAALLLARGAAPTSTWRWFGVGALVAAGVLLRETLAPFALLGLCAVWWDHGRRAALWFGAGGAVTGVCVLALIVLLRGGAHGLLEAYRDAGIVYQSLQAQRAEFFHNAVVTSFNVSRPALFIAATGIAIALALRLITRDTRGLARALFWCGCALVALIEPATKIGFPYHFAVALPALALLTAMAWRTVFTALAGTREAAAAASLAALAALSLVQPVSTQLAALPEAARSASTTLHKGWAIDAASASNYLLAGEMIQHATPPGGTASVSGFMFSLYPISGTLPPSGKLGNLSALLIQLGLDPRQLQQAIASCPPDVIMTTTRTDWPGAPELEAAVVGTGLYQPFGVVPVDPSKPYGTFGGTVYRRTDTRAHHCAL